MAAIDPATQSTPHKETKLITAVGVLLVLVAAGVVAIGPVALPAAPAFLPFYGGIIIVTDFLTAYLLLSQFRITGLPSAAMLSAAYLYSSLIVIPHLLFFPNLLAPHGVLGAGSQSAVWLWVLWHTGFPTLVLGYAATEYWQRNRAPLDRAAIHRLGAILPFIVIAVVIGLAVLVSAGNDYLPVLIKGSDFSALSDSLIGYTARGANLIALVTVVLVTRCRTVAHRGLTLALLAGFLDAALTLHSQERFSVGWYVARINSVISASAVLAVFLYEVAWLYNRIAALNESLSRLAFVDELTGLANRRQFNERLLIEWKRAARHKEPIALLMIDVDFFKKYNDRYGHPAGDTGLRQVARAIGGSMQRPADLAARYGGEEFVVVLPSTGAEGALKVANTIGEAVRRLAIRHDAGTALGIMTVSIGVAAIYPADTTSPDILTAAADKALYDAKGRGRNQALLAA